MGTPVIPTVGLGRVAEVSRNDCTHIAVGTGTTPPTSADTTLETETNRNAISNSFRSNNKFQVRTLMTNSNLPTTVEEMGLFMNGSAAADTGSLLVRVLEQFTKGSADLLVVFELTVQEA